MHALGDSRAQRGALPVRLFFHTRRISRTRAGEKGLAETALGASDAGAAASFLFALRLGGVAVLRV